MCGKNDWLFKKIYSLKFYCKLIKNGNLVISSILKTNNPLQHWLYFNIAGWQIKRGPVSKKTPALPSGNDALAALAVH